MRSRSPRMRGEGHQEGSALLEVMVAVALLGTLLGALATEAQRGVDAAVRLREKGAALSAVTADDPDLDAWDWGARVAGVSWAAGRVLHVYGVVEPGVQCTVGVWCAGWRLGEWNVSTAEPLALGSAIWEGHTGEELVVRALAAGGSWGPPWRTVVPDAYGRNTVEPALSNQDPLEIQTFETVQTVAHLLCQSTSLPRVSWSGSPVTENVSDVALVLSEYDRGLCCVSVGDRTQAWVGSNGRKLDVYF